MADILKTNSLSKSYKNVQALQDLNITVKKGQVYGLLGPNGSGKTTTLGILLGVIKPDNGKFNWFGNNQRDENRKNIGALLETPNFYPYLNAVDNLKIVAEIKSMDNVSDRIETVLRRVDLWKRKSAKFKTFSLGMKQRLAIASALLADPEVLVLDEPTNGLDPQGIAEIRSLILDVASTGKTIIIASHILDEIEKVCTHVAILKSGKLIKEATLEEILIQDKLLCVNSDNREELLNAIEEIPEFKYIKDLSGEILISVGEERTNAEVNKIFAEKGIYLSSLSLHRKNLESTFLEIVSS
ncbi:ABC transporter ATP-binding protein [Brumimicrobium aurantiacum]|uniref:ATP-binding cassette domain-containing protein n=1 Tax=Brumimicrobium aurantiacum TaxID=1737063 RepID=A0A3E1EX20_9FLAO|nr:ATP-binding cassette domain-containing protein [Brumimicrobium aurantiacum]RFC54097.1 ATP-binding cassette domain-containing protein [Brumimicrobium aurantiacum]